MTELQALAHLDDLCGAITQDRYQGAYSGGAWLAWPCDHDEIPPAAIGQDHEAQALWGVTGPRIEWPKDYAPPWAPVGKGDTPTEALIDLAQQVQDAGGAQLFEELWWGWRLDAADRLRAAGVRA